jgi:hypothetical protein
MNTASLPKSITETVNFFNDYHKNSLKLKKYLFGVSR